MSDFGDLTRSFDRHLTKNFRVPTVEDMMMRQAQADLAKNAYDHVSADQLQAAARRRQTVDNRITKFRETYVKLRTDNIVLDHKSAIELAKMIHSEADLITVDDLP